MGGDRIAEAPLLQVLKSSGNEALQRVFSQDGFASDLDVALADLDGPRVVRRSDVRRRRTASDGTDGGGVAVADVDLEVESGRDFVEVPGLERRERARGDVVRLAPSGEPERGRLSAERIRAVVREALRAIKVCYERALAKEPRLQGEVVVRFTIGTDGGVTEYAIASSTLQSPQVEACILRLVRRWRFPAPEGGPVTVTYPFLFTSTG